MPNRPVGHASERGFTLVETMVATVLLSMMILGILQVLILSLIHISIPGPESDSLAARYRDLAEREQGVTFIGRLAQYRYLNMDQVVGAALHTFEKLRAASP